MIKDYMEAIKELIGIVQTSNDMIRNISASEREDEKHKTEMYLANVQNQVVSILVELVASKERESWRTDGN